MNDEEKPIISQDALFAIAAISGIAVIYSIWPKIGIALAALIIVVAAGNLYERGVIKPIGSK